MLDYKIFNCFPLNSLKKFNSKLSYHYRDRYKIKLISQKNNIYADCIYYKFWYQSHTIMDIINSNSKICPFKYGYIILSIINYNYIFSVNI